MKWEAAGGLVGGKPVICGGKNGFGYTDASANCYEHDQAANTWTHSLTMPQKRRGMAAVSIDDDTLWLSGGYKMTQYTQTQGTGYNYKAGQAAVSTGQNMFPARVFHCIVKISETQYFTGGTGWTGNFKRNFLYNGNPGVPAGSWTELPQLSQGRNTPFCGLVTRSNGVQEVEDCTVFI